MKITNFLLRVTSMTFAAILFIALFTTGLNAQWKSDSTSNTAVCVMPGNQFNPQIISDGNNGVIIVWEDYRNNSNWDIFGQHLDATGKKLWPDTGVAICNFGYDQRYPVICSDDSGGAYVVWQDYRLSSVGQNGIELYGQRVRGDGKLAYNSAGISIGAGVRDQVKAAICHDGSGHAFVAWEDNRNTNAASRPDIYMQYMSWTNGANWAAGGLGVVTSNQAQKRPRLCDDGSGGCLLLWENASGTPQSIWGSRVDATGALLWGPPPPLGLELYKGPSGSNLSRNVEVVRDGNQFCIAWEESDISSSNGQNIRANRFDMSGNKVWFTAAEVTGSWPSDQINPRPMSDDSGGMMVVFEDLSFGDISPYFYNHDIAAVRVLANGAELLPPAGSGFYNVCHQTKGQTDPQVARLESSNGSILVAWNDARYYGTGVDTAIYCQVLDRTPKRYLPVAGTNSTVGQPIVHPVGHMAKQVVLAPRATFSGGQTTYNSGAIAAWVENRNGSANFDVYAQLVFKNGTLPIEFASFDVRAQGSNAVLNWSTAMEKDNAGFEIERRRIDEASTSNIFQTVASFTEYSSLRGVNNSNSIRSYSFSDAPGSMGVYEYRIADVGLDGTRTVHSAKRVNILQGATSGFSLSELQPNPVHDRAWFTVSSPVNARVTYHIMDVLGRTVLENSQMFGAGSQKLELDLSNTSLKAGSYFVTVTATDPSDGATLWTSDKARVMKIVR